MPEFTIGWVGHYGEVSMSWGRACVAFSNPCVIDWIITRSIGSPTLVYAISVIVAHVLGRYKEGFGIVGVPSVTREVMDPLVNGETA